MSIIVIDLTSDSTYRSPIRLMDELGISLENLSHDQLKQERKRLLLEIQFSEDQFIEIGDKSYTKNDVIQSFEEFENCPPEDIEFHKAIYTHDELLNFLERQEVEWKLIKLESVAEKIDHRKEEFIQFLSPYLLIIIRKLLSDSIEEANFLKLDRIQNVFEFLTPDDARLAFKQFEDFCLSLDQHLTQAVQKYREIAGTELFPRNDTNFLHYRPFYNITNCVAQFYPDLPDEVVRAVLSFVDLTKGSLGENDSQHKILTQTKILRCSEELDKIVSEKAEQFPSKHDLDGGPGITGHAFLKIMFIVLLASFWFSRSCEDDKRDKEQERIEQLFNQEHLFNSPEYPPVSVEFTEFYFKKLQESILTHAQNKSVEENGDSDHNVTPAVSSRFCKPPPGDEFRFRNKTQSEMLIMVWSGRNLNSYYVKQNSTTNFKALNDSEILIYAGRNWQTQRGLRTTLDGLTPTTINGSFEHTSRYELDLLRKRFKLDDVTAKGFIIWEKDSVFQLHQEGHLVKFSY